MSQKRSKTPPTGKFVFVPGERVRLCMDEADLGWSSEVLAKYQGAFGTVLEDEFEELGLNGLVFVRLDNYDGILKENRFGFTRREVARLKPLRIEEEVAPWDLTLSTALT